MATTKMPETPAFWSWFEHFVWTVESAALRPMLERALGDARVDALIVPIGKGVLVCRKDEKLIEQGLEVRQLSERRLIAVK